MIGRLVQNQEIRFCNEHIGQRHTLELSARKLGHGLLKVIYLKA